MWESDADVLEAPMCGFSLAMGSVMSEYYTPMCGLSVVNG